ncbi:MFS transporter [Nonomuraea insulae]|uniref:MFS transporter n=1 Tax=Nonomuraea insulae TaxID=1616787 RepID=A0ABW1DBU2_9ACTN
MRDELRPFRSPAVWGALATTAIGFGGLFASFTYISPLLTTLTGFPESALTWLLMIYGAGLVVGNWAGGRAADRYPNATITVLLVLLLTGLIAQSLPAPFPAPTIVMLFVIGAAGFGLIAPLQNRVLSVAGDAATMISTANIAAFNLGATLASLAGAATLNAGLGYAGAAMTLIGLVIFSVTRRAGRVLPGRGPVPEQGADRR